MTGLDISMVPMLLPDWLDPEKIISSAGPWALWVVAFIVFAECGLFSLLPGDSLLFTVGMFCAGGLSGGAAAIHYFESKPLTLIFSCIVLTICAILGNVAGYYLGRLIGPPLFKPRAGLMGKVFDPVYVDKTHEFFEKYGSRALILARFVPMVRTFVTLVAGVSHMNFRKFIEFTAIGGVLWVWSITVIGYFLGQIPFIQHNLEYMALLIVAVSILPMVFEYWNARKDKKGALPVDADLDD
ncbi:DedA family protein [Mariniluteicoccus endophyticus]